jgi:hypothetical protein
MIATFLDSNFPQYEFREHALFRMRFLDFGTCCELFGARVYGNDSATRCISALKKRPSLREIEDNQEMTDSDAEILQSNVHTAHQHVAEQLD